MNATQINQTTDLIPLVGIELRKAGEYHIGPCPFCGGRDRFTVKHTGDGDRWHCRKCSNEKYSTPIDYVMRRDMVDFRTACRTLGGANPVVSHRSSLPREKPRGKPLELPSPDWQSQALKEMDTSSDRLLEGDDGRAGRDYLVRRGLSPAVWEAWHLGFSQAWDSAVKRLRPAIVIPWLDMDATKEVIMAIKYRFIDDDPEGQRFTARAGSVPLLFGLWDVVDSDDALVLVEGEMNALSIWQCRPRGVSVLSIGGETGGRPDVLRAVARSYKRVVIWCDNPERTRKYQSMLARACRKLQSPEQVGVKLDANRLLQMDQLRSLLTAVLDVPCQ